MKNIKTLLLFLLVSTISYGQITIGENNSRGCGTCNDSNNDITVIDNDTFRARYAQAYWWEICDGNATIVGSNTSRNVNISGVSGQTSTIKLTRFYNGNCIESCEIFTISGSSNTCPPASCLDIVEVDNCVDYQAWMNCNDPTIDYINWYYTISGSYIHVPFWTSGGNPAGQHSAPLSLPTPPTGSWDNYNLYIYAEVVFDDGEVCDEIYTYITLDCSGNGTGNQKKMSISPNPAKPSSKITLNGVEIKDIDNIEVLDIFGNSKMKFKPTYKEFKLENLSSGIYFIKIYTSKGIEQKKIIIE
ncbi:hypothetical protein FBALC1_13782 [Flavobacteriales bacterium ALC-1]|nr:hypothetical protein FBALC1_13782 [Flavobacteriales bacterium ALC-1]